MTTAAAQKRFDALAAITTLALDPENGWKVRPECTVGKVVKAIRDLKPLGRTQRWGIAIVKWEAMILECDDEQYGDAHSEAWNAHMHWAVLQGQIFAGYAAE